MKEIYVCTLCGTEYNTMEQSDTCHNEIHQDEPFCGETFYKLENGQIINAELAKDMGYVDESYC